MFVDTHCHLNNDTLYKIRHEIIKEASDVNVKLFIVPGYDLNFCFRNRHKKIKSW